MKGPSDSRLRARAGAPAAAAAAAAGSAGGATGVVLSADLAGFGRGGLPSDGPPGGDAPAGGDEPAGGDAPKGPAAAAAPSALASAAAIVTAADRAAGGAAAAPCAALPFASACWLWAMLAPPLLPPSAMLCEADQLAGSQPVLLPLLHAAAVAAACWLGGAGLQRKTTEKAMQKQASATHGLSRSPTRANFQNRPLNLAGAMGEGWAAVRVSRRRVVAGSRQRPASRVGGDCGLGRRAQQQAARLTRCARSAGWGLRRHRGSGGGVVRGRAAAGASTECCTHRGPPQLTRPPHPRTFALDKGAGADGQQQHDDKGGEVEQRGHAGPAEEAACMRGRGEAARRGRVCGGSAGGGGGGGPCRVGGSGAPHLRYGRTAGVLAGGARRAGLRQRARVGSCGGLRLAWGPLGSFSNAGQGCRDAGEWREGASGRHPTAL